MKTISVALAMAALLLEATECGAAQDPSSAIRHHKFRHHKEIHVRQGPNLKPQADATPTLLYIPSF